MEANKEKQYDRLINARNFHYENLNKWLMSFYAIIAALFVAFYKLYSENPNDKFIIVIAILGYVVSVGALLSVKGYYYWETNWILLVHHFEKVNYDKKDDRIYSVFANFDTNNSSCPTEGANISTTKVALAITTIIAIIWGMISFYYGINFLEKFDAKLPSQRTIAIWSFIASFILTLVLIAAGANKKYLQSNLENLSNMGLTKENMGIEQGEDEE